MKNKLLFLLLSLFTISSKASINSTKVIAKTLNYCVSAAKINFNPFRKIEDGKDLSYLMLLKSYISTEKDTDGLLEAYEFSPDGRVFTGRVSPTARWSDGSALTSTEAALGITKALPFRLLGERVSMAAITSVKAGTNISRDLVGVEVIDQANFKLHFVSKIANLTGVIREALSTNSRHNRFWPSKLHPHQNNQIVDVIGKEPISFIDGHYSLNVDQQVVSIRNDSNNCRSDFTMFPELILAEIDRFDLFKSPSAAEAVAEMNSQHLTKMEREALGSAIRLAFSRLPKNLGFKLNNGFFEPGETGHVTEAQWERHIDYHLLQKRSFTIAYEIPILKKILGPELEKMGIKTTSISVPFEQENVDVQILAAGIQNGRHVILQDILSWPHVSAFLYDSPQTILYLKKIASSSATTLPPDERVLREFERAASTEFTLVPLGRRYSTAYNLKNSPVQLAWSSHGELGFKKR